MVVCGFSTKDSVDRGLGLHGAVGESLGSFRGPLGGLWEAPGGLWGPVGQWWVYRVYGFLWDGLWGAMGVLGSPQDVDTLYHAGERRCFDLRDFSHLESR